MTLLAEQLVRRALGALQEIAYDCGKAPVPKSLSLRFLLMFTWAASPRDPTTKWKWDDFWQHATGDSDMGHTQDDYCRFTGATSALNGICSEIGYLPDPRFMQHLRRQKELDDRLALEACRREDAERTHPQLPPK